MIPWPELRQTSPTRRAQTIVQAASLFNQLLQRFPRTEFAALVKKHGAERAAKGFTCWTQFVAHAVLPTGPRRSAARHLQRPGLLFRPSGACRYCYSSPAAPPCPTPTSTVRPPCLRNCSGPRAGALSRETTGLGLPQAQVPLQEQTVVAGFDHLSRYASRCFRGRSSAAPRAA